jgi:tetratricopeptide (TPR) repeat protein
MSRNDASRREIGAGLLLLALAFVAYVPALGAGFIWDDDDYVTENPTLLDADGLYRIWFEIGAVPQYYPLVHTTFWIEHKLWGLEPLGFHAVNVLLHGINGFVFWRVLRRLGVGGAWIAAAVFVLHPVHVESVAWITERKNVLSGCLYLLALQAWLRLEDRAGGSDRPPAGRYLTVLALFVAALLAKTVTASLPAVLLVVSWWRRDRLGRTALLTLPMFAIGAAAGLLTVWMERSVVGAVGADWSLSLAERGLVAGRALWFYLGKLAWPDPLIFVYPRFSIDAGELVSWLWPIGALIAAAALWALRESIGRAPLAAALYFGLTLGPALGFLDVYPMRFSYVADHFQYLASLGPIALMVGACVSLVQRRDPRVQRVAVALAAVVLLALGARTWVQTHVYESAETLWRATLQRNPAAHIAHNNLGGLLLARSSGDPTAGTALLDEAEAHFREAAAIDYPEAHNNLGIVLHRRGRLEEAVASYREALRLLPGFADAENNLGISLASLGRLGEAGEHFEEAVRLDPALASARFNLGSLRLYEGRIREAVAQLGEAARLDPEDPETRRKLDEAREQLRAVAPRPPG